MKKRASRGGTWLVVSMVLLGALALFAVVWGVMGSLLQGFLIAPRQPESAASAPRATPARATPAPVVTKHHDSSSPPVGSPPAVQARAGGAVSTTDRLRAMRAEPGEVLGRMEMEFSENFQYFSDPVRLEQLKMCTQSWNPPEGVHSYVADLVLGLEAVDGGLVVRDSEITTANVGDDDLEKCILDTNQGLFVPVHGAIPGQLYRIVWPLSLSHHSN